MTFEECELAILRKNIDEADTVRGHDMVQSTDTKKMIRLVEAFIASKKLICYGGTAINNILPKTDRFYDDAITVPDYDFFSPNALSDARELADVYHKNGFEIVEAKSGTHHGTYKVFVKYTPIADITHMDPGLFARLKKTAIVRDKIAYAPPNFLRMSMYLELSRPKGDVSRWEKVLKRMILLNKTYPLKDTKCAPETIHRQMSAREGLPTDMFHTIRRTLVKHDCVFFGSYALSAYYRYATAKGRDTTTTVPDFDVISTQAADVAEKLRRAIGAARATVVAHENMGEVIPRHYEVKYEADTVAFLYEPLGCHNYNTVRLQNETIRVATIDTMLSFYLAFIYSGKPYHDTNRIMCMATYLFQVQRKNRLAQTGLLRRFGLTCLGHQPTMEDAREQKKKMHDELWAERKRGTQEWDEWFLQYSPADERKRRVVGLSVGEKNKRGPAKKETRSQNQKPTAATSSATAKTIRVRARTDGRSSRDRAGSNNGNGRRKHGGPSTVRVKKMGAKRTARHSSPTPKPKPNRTRSRGRRAGTGAHKPKSSAPLNLLASMTPLDFFVK